MNTEDLLLQKVEEQAQTIESLTKRIEEYKILATNRDLKDVEKDYKDRLFKFIFGNPDNKQWTLSLYNAMNGTSYTNPEDIQFNTIGDAVYMRMKNDMSFIVAFEMDLWEHQSSFNPNMPMRFFIYAGRLYEKYIATSDYYQYSTSLQPVPRPKCICFYNGIKEQPEDQVLKLSDAYKGGGDNEVKVTMLERQLRKEQEADGGLPPAAGV